MGLLDSLQIGGNALLTQQAAIQVTGNNIANAATPGYARQEAVLSPHGVSTFDTGATAGGGVKLASVERLIDNALQQRLNDANSQMQQYAVADTTLARVESLMNELTDNDLSTSLTELFNSFSALAADPASSANRDMVISQASTVVNQFEFIASGLNDIDQSLTEQLESAVVEADTLAQQIADLNIQIVNTEAGGVSAASLRDQRDQAVTSLSELIAVNVREEDNGSVNVFVGSEMLVSRGTSRGLCMAGHASSPYEAPVMTVSFADNNGAVDLNGGSIAGLQNTRDGELAEVSSRIDTLAHELIWEVNKLHAGGTPADGYQEITGTYLVEDPAAALTDPTAGLSFTPENGSFLVKLATTAPDGTVTVDTTQINVACPGDGSDMSLNDLVAALDAVDGLDASVNVSGAIQIATTNPNTAVSFAEDSSGVLAALGVGTFFTGASASTIGVNQTVVDNRNHIAAGLTDRPGDGDNAALIAALGDTTSALSQLGGRSLLGYQQELVADVAVWTANAADTAAANEVVFNSLTAQRESLSGVSIDEEAVNLMQYQSAYQGAARFVSVVNELLETLMTVL